MQEQTFVGRERELGQLWGYLGDALAWKGRACFVVGQAGSGKTALVRQFLQQALLTDPSLVVATGTGNAQTGIGDPYLPFREALTMLTVESPSHRAAGQIAPENTERLQRVLVRSIQVVVEAAPQLVGALVPGGVLVGALGKAVVNKVGWMEQLDELAEQQSVMAGSAAVIADQTRIFEQYTAFLKRLSETMPIVLFLDDLQWADSASISLLFHLARHVEEHPILIVGAYRPDDVALGRNGGRHPLEPVVNELTRYYGDLSIDLDIMPEEVSRLFVHSLLDTEPHCLNEAFERALYSQTNGHALFTTELLRAMKAKGDLVQDRNGCWVDVPSLDWEVLPEKVEGVIEERIARLDGRLREMLVVGSVEGEEFSAEVVAQVCSLSKLETLRHLSSELEEKHRLVTAQGMTQFDSLRLSIYRFWHSLFQEYLYDSLDEVERAYLHQHVGDVLEALFGLQTEEMAPQLARHFEKAGVASKAAAYRLQAGKNAHRVSAHQEATSHLEKGIQLLDGVPPGSERAQLELGLQTALGTARIATHGYASPEVEQAFTRAREICRVMGDPPQVIPVLYGLCLFRMVRGQLKNAYEEGQQLILLAQKAEDVGYGLGCKVQLGVCALYMGHFRDARRFLQEAGNQYDPGLHGELAYRHGQDPGVTALSYLSWVLWVQGYPDQAREKSQAALILAEQIGHPYSLGLARAFAAKLHELLREWPECQAQAEAALLLADQGRFSLWQAMARMLRGTAMAYQGWPEEGTAELSTGLSELAATGTQLAVPYFRTRLAESYLLSGRREEGLRAVEDIPDDEEQAWWLPEQYRIRAELLLLAPGAHADAEAFLRLALAAARSTGARMLELRVAMTLSCFLQQQGRPDEGRDLLAGCYAWFDEGLETADLRDARACLDTFSPAVENFGLAVQTISRTGEKARTAMEVQ